MQIVQAVRFGGPDVLELAEAPDPTPGPGQITIDVTHAAVGLIDVYLRQGLYKDQPGLPDAPFVPGLEIAGTVRQVGDGVTEFAVGERVVSMSSGGGVGGYASVYLADASSVASLEGRDIDSAAAVAAIPNAAMAHVAMTEVAHLREGERVLVHGALGGFAAAFPGMAKHLGASRVVGTVHERKLSAARHSGLPYDRIVDSAEMASALDEERFDVVIDPVGGDVRSASLPLMDMGGRLIASGNASGDWGHTVESNELWFRNLTVSGFNAGGYLPAHPETVRPALDAALDMVEAGGASIAIDVMTFDEARLAHERMESRSLDGRIVLTPRS